MPLRVSFRTLPSILLLILMLAVACDSPNDDIHLVSNGFNPNAPQTNEFTLRDEVRVLPPNSGLVINQIGDNTLTLSGVVPTLKVGDILIENSGPQKFARKVLSWQQSNGTTVVTTGPISLTDVFAEANIARSELISPQLLSQLESALPGVTVGDAVLAQSNGQDASFSVPVHFNNVLLGDKNDANQVLANGTLNIQVGLETALRIDNFAQLKQFRLVPYFQAQGQLKLQAAGGVTFRKRVPVTHTLTVPLGAIGPLTLDGGIRLVIDAEGRVAARGVVEISGGVEAGGGVDFDGENWTVPRFFDYAFEVKKPTVQGELGLSVAVLNPELSLGLLGIGDAYVSVKAMQAHATLAYQVSPQPGFTFTKETNMAISAGVNLNLGPVNIFNGELPSVNTPRVPLSPPEFLPAAEVNLPAAALTVSPSDKTLNVNESTTLTAEAVFPGSPIGVPVPVQWSSSNPSAVSVQGHGPTATVTALQANQSAVVRASALGQTGTARIVVSPPTLQTLTIEPGNPRVMATSDLPLTVRARYSDGKSYDLTHLAQFSTDSDLIRLNASGRVTGLKPGSATVSARVGELSGSTRVEVFPRQYSRQVLTPKPKTLELNESKEILAIAYYLDGSHRFNERQVTWNSTNPAVVSVDNEGRIRGLSPGTATISAVLPGTGLSDAFTVTVARPPIRSLTLTPQSSDVFVGDTVNYSVRVTYVNGISADVTGEALLANFWGDVVSLDEVNKGRVRAVKRGYDIILARLPEANSPVALAEISVTGPSLLKIVQAPTSVVASQDFSLQLETLISGGQRFGGSLPVSLRLRSGGSVLSGPTNGTTSAGLVTFNGLSLSAPGEYEILVDSPGLQSVSLPIQVTSSGGGGPLTSTNLFIATSGGLALGQLSSSGSLQQAPGSPYEIGTAAHGVATLGDFVYAVNKTGQLFTFEFDPAAQTLAPLGAAFAAGAAAEPTLLTSNLSNAVYAKNETGTDIRLYIVDPSTGELVPTVGGASSHAGYTSSLVYESHGPGGGTLFDLNWSAQLLYSFQANANGTLSSGDSLLVGGPNDYPAGLAVVGDSVYVGVRSTSSSPSSRLLRLTLDRNTGALSHTGQSWTSGVSGMANGFVDGPVDLTAYQHPTLGPLLFAAHSGGAVTRFAVTASGSLNQFAQSVTVGSHPRRMRVIGTSSGDFLVVTCDSAVEVFAIGPFDGNLTEVTGSPFTAFSGSFGLSQ